VLLPLALPFLCTSAPLFSPIGLPQSSPASFDQQRSPGCSPSLARSISAARTGKRLCSTGHRTSCSHSRPIHTAKDRASDNHTVLCSPQRQTHQPHRRADQIMGRRSYESAENQPNRRRKRMLPRVTHLTQRQHTLAPLSTYCPVHKGRPRFQALSQVTGNLCFCFGYMVYNKGTYMRGARIPGPVEKQAAPTVLLAWISAASCFWLRHPAHMYRARSYCATISTCY
jgi:hypothetical protein